MLTTGRLACGDVEAALAGAAHVAAGAWRTGFVEHAYIEPEAGWARRVGDRMEVFASTQAPYMDLEEVAGVLGIPHAAVRIVPTACGGGFGGKLDVAVQPMIAVAAWLLGRPVRAVWTRGESMASSTKRHPARIAARAGCDAAGRLVGFEFEGVYDTGAYASWGPTVAGRVPAHSTGPYRMPHARSRARAVLTNNPPSGAFRGFGVPQAAIAQEALWDRLADAAGLDRLEFRVINALRRGRCDGDRAGHRPFGRAGGMPGGAAAALAGAAGGGGGGQCARRAAAAWRRRRLHVVRHRQYRHVQSLDHAGDARPGRAAGLPQRRGGYRPGQHLGAAADRGRCGGAAGGAISPWCSGDTDLTADAGKTSASRQTFVSGRAAMEAGLALRDAILLRANAGPEARLALAAAGGCWWMGGRLRWRRRWRGSGASIRRPCRWTRMARASPYATYGFAAQLAALAVDTELGTVRLDRIVAAHDVGRAINPMLVEGQIEGGIAQGIGLALLEEYLPGRTENLHDYLIPTIGDVPAIECILIEDPEPLGPYGAKGIGEPALVPTAPAIFSAIRDATGAEITRVPALPHRVLEALRRR